MKISTRPTKHFLVAAYTSDDYDSVDFALITITDEYKEILKDRVEKSKLVCGIPSFSGLTFYDHAPDFYCLQEEGEDHDQIRELLDKGICSFVEITEEEIAELNVPQNRLDCPEMEVHVSGSLFHYKCDARDTSEHFWTETLSLEDLKV